MKKVTEQERKRINIAAANFLCEQEEGDYCDAYLKLVEESEKGNGFHNANNYIEVWQGVENMTVENLLDAIDSAIVEPVVPEFIQKIDWSELRNQKTALVNHIADLRNDSSEVNQIQAKNELADYLEGILSLIDAVQDYAVDVAEIAKEIDVYDFELEDGELCTAGLFVGDYSKSINNQTKTIWVCPNCGSDNVQFKTWTDANSFKATDDECPMDDEDCWCKDCENHGKLILKEI